MAGSRHLSLRTDEATDDEEDDDEDGGVSEEEHILTLLTGAGSSTIGFSRQFSFWFTRKYSRIDKPRKKTKDGIDGEMTVSTSSGHVGYVMSRHEMQRMEINK